MTRTPHEFLTGSAEEAPEPVASLPQDSQKPGPTSKNITLGRVAQLARARRLQRQTGVLSPSGGDQQEQPFAQVSAEYSLSSKWQRVASSGTGWTKFRMSFRARIG